MARPRSDDKRKAIMAATIRVILSQGLSGPTALIASEAGVSNGTLFVYFKTKSELFNQLYLELKSELALSAMENVMNSENLKEQLQHAWSNWMTWAASYPEKRRVLAQLNSYEDISPETRAAVRASMANVGALMEKCRVNGALRDVPTTFAFSMMNSLAESTMEYMAQDVANAELHCQSGFEALCRLIA